MLLGFCLLFSGYLRAQLGITVQVPPVGVIQKTQLWNLLLVNAGDVAYDVEVNITVSAAPDNNPVMTGAGKMVHAPKGTTQLRYADFEPVSYRYLSPAFNNDLRPDGFIPVGSYTVCYTVGRWKGDAWEPLTEDCIHLEVQPLSPPVLNTPADKDSIMVLYPQFTWLPPAPLSLFSALTYDLVVAPVLAGQSPEQAIQQNMPVYTEGNLSNVMSVYPASAHALDTSRWYAWAVIARNNRQVISQSEVWTFWVKGGQKTEAELESASLVVLKKEEEAIGVTALPGEKIGIHYYSFDTAYKATLQFVGADGKVIQEVEQQVSYGDNAWRLPLNKTFRANTVYRLQLTTPTRQRYTAAFYIQQKTK